MVLINNAFVKNGYGGPEVQNTTRTNQTIIRTV